MKVYFGISGGGSQSEWLNQVGVHYILLSFYHQPILNEKEQGFLKPYKHIIVDSGLFTFMFGAKAGTPMPWEFCTDWQAKYVAYLNKYFPKSTSCVELDVQKKLGVAEAWELRRMLKRSLKGREMISVYHLEDGNPDKLIQWSDYIAVSQPELRGNVSKKDRRKITSYIANKAVSLGKKVHLLGLTELDYMKEYSYCTSCDSTSWHSQFRWGLSVTQTWKVPYGVIKSQPLGDKRTRSNCDHFWSGYFFLQEYKRHAGDQS